MKQDSLSVKKARVSWEKRKENIGILCSAEKGKNVTVIYCVSASGTYIPPMFIFPRVRVRDAFVDRGPVGSIQRAHKTGWVSEELFEEWFNHFVTCVQPKTRKEPTLLLADGHVTHTNNLSLVEKARENNVVP